MRVLCGREEQEEEAPVVTVCKVRMVSMVQRAEPGKAGLAEWQYTAFGITVYPTNKEVKAGQFWREFEGWWGSCALLLEEQHLLV